MLKYFIISFHFSFFFSCLFGQNPVTPDSLPGKIQVGLKEKEKMLMVFGDSILHGSNDLTRKQFNEVFTREIKSLLLQPMTYDYHFDSLSSVSVLKSNDGLVKIYTWILPATDRNSYSYFGIIQIKDRKSKNLTVYELTEKKYENEATLNKVLESNEWYGALYYKIVEKKFRHNTIYTLLGWHGKNRKTNRKIIDVLRVRPGKIIFGAPVFIDNGKTYSRMIFEFTAQAVMKLNYDERKKMIVFDRLSPAPGAEKGQYEFYGPDFRYDGLQFKKGAWIIKKDIDLRNPKSFDTKDGKKGNGKSLYESGK